MTRSTFRTPIITCLLLAAGLVMDGPSWVPTGLALKDAQARVGRPATPGSVAGVARRTTRRRIRRSTIYVASLPRSCSQVNVEGTVLMLCSGTYYQAVSGQYQVVYVD